MSKTLITLNNVSKIFRTDTIETHALDNISLQIKAGEFVSITGTSGSGKSTLLSLLGLLDNTSAGEYWLSDVATHTLTRAQLSQIRNRYIGWIFQDFNLLPKLTVAENVALPLRYSKTIAKSEVVTKVNEVLNLVNMSHRKGHFPSQLSGGQKQRVAIARGLVTDPAIILADEPTGNLDSQNSATILELLLKLNESSSCTVVLVTHDMQAASIAKRQLKMADGKLYEA